MIPTGMVATATATMTATAGLITIGIGIGIGITMVFQITRTGVRMTLPATRHGQIIPHHPTRRL